MSTYEYLQSDSGVTVDKKKKKRKKKRGDLLSIAMALSSDAHVEQRVNADGESGRSKEQRLACDLRSRAS